MPSHRLTIVFVAVIFLSGCTIPALDAGSSEPKPLPEKPQQLTNRSVQTFVETTEERRLYNEALASGPTESLITCEAVVEEKHELAYLLYVQCLGGIELSGGEHVDIAELSFYSVSPQTTKQSTYQNITSRTYNQSKPGTSGFQLVNFGNSTQNVTISIGPTKGNSGSEFTTTYTLHPSQTVIQNFLPYEFNTTHRMRVQTSNGTTTFAFTPQKKQTLLTHGTTIFILRNGHVEPAEIPPNMVRSNRESRQNRTMQTAIEAGTHTSVDGRGAGRIRSEP